MESSGIEGRAAANATLADPLGPVEDEGLEVAPAPCVGRATTRVNHRVGRCAGLPWARTGRPGTAGLPLPTVRMHRKNQPPRTNLPRTQPSRVSQLRECSQPEPSSRGAAASTAAAAIRIDWLELNSLVATSGRHPAPPISHRPAQNARSGLASVRSQSYPCKAPVNNRQPPNPRFRQSAPTVPRVRGWKEVRCQKAGSGRWLGIRAGVPEQSAPCTPHAMPQPP